MDRKHQTGKVYFLKFNNGVTLGPFSMLWESDERGITYTFGAFAMTDEGYKVRNSCDYALLSHGVFWMQHLPEGQFGLQRNDGTAEIYDSCEAIENR